MAKRKRHGTASVHEHTSKVCMGMIQDVDPNTYTCTVVTPRNGVHKGVPINPVNMGKDGGGNFFMPEVNSPVWICRPSDQSAPFIMAAATVPRELGGNDEEEPNDHRMGRPRVDAGDQVMAGPGLNPFIALRKGGNLEIGSNQSNQRIYLALDDTIREFFSNWEQNAAGGKLEWKSRTDDPTHGSGKDPVEFRLQIKEFAGEDPMIDIGLGRIKDENAQSVVNGSEGDIVGRVLINDQFELWIDKKGNTQTLQGGNRFTKISGKDLNYTHGDFFQQVRGIGAIDYGTRQAVIHSSDSLEVKGNQDITIGGQLTETISGPVTRVTGPVTEEIKGAHEKSVQGDLNHTLTGNMQSKMAGDYLENVGVNSKEIIGGKKEITVANSNWLTGEDLGYKLAVNQGGIEIQGITAAITIKMGISSALPFGEIKISPTGAIFLENMFGTLCRMEMNATGLQITTAAGELSIDQAGTMFMGMKGAAGAVVTTLTHPVCYVTGAPILGASSVGASGIPSPVALPSAFVSEALL
jgi:hypothetical protein